MAQFKTPLDQANDLIREARKDTLNNRINYKGNYENYITGGSHALDNQAELNDKNNHAVNIYRAKKGEVKNDYTNDPWIEGLNDRYTNPQHNERAGNAPYGSGLNYIHRYTPSTKRGRRANDIYFEAAKNGKTPYDLFEVQDLVGNYEGNGNGWKEEYEENGYPNVDADYERSWGPVDTKEKYKAYLKWLAKGKK